MTDASAPDLSATQLFTGIDPALYLPVLKACEIRALDTGQILLQAGERNYELFVLLSGQVRIRLDLDDHTDGIPMDAGECIGEMSIIDNQPVSAYVVADAPSEVLAIPQDLFWSTIVAIPGVARNLGALFAQRMRKQNDIARKAIEQELRLEHLETELNHAREIQLSLLPQQRPLLPESSPLTVAAIMDAAREVGGDLYDVITLDERRVAIVIGDVSGKGMPAALFMVKSQTLLRSAFRADVPIEVAITEVNQQLSRDNEACMFITVFAVVIDLETGEIGYIHGGHNYPYLIGRHGPPRMLEMPLGMVVGVSDMASYQASQMTLSAGDTLILYTDGVTEAHNPQNEAYGEERLEQLLETHREASCDELVALIREDVQQFSDGRTQFDDITIVVIRYQPS